MLVQNSKIFEVLVLESAKRVQNGSLVSGNGCTYVYIVFKRPRNGLALQLINVLNKITWSVLMLAYVKASLSSATHSVEHIAGMHPQ